MVPSETIQVTEMLRQDVKTQTGALQDVVAAEGTKEGPGIRGTPPVVTGADTVARKMKYVEKILRVNVLRKTIHHCKKPPVRTASSIPRLTVALPERSCARSGRPVITAGLHRSHSRRSLKRQKRKKAFSRKCYRCSNNTIMPILVHDLEKTDGYTRSRTVQGFKISPQVPWQPLVLHVSQDVAALFRPCVLPRR